MRKTCLPFLASVAVCVALLCTTQPASAQELSTVDTMRIVDASAYVGDTVIIEFYMRNVDTLGGYAFRLHFDPTLIEPLTDTVIADADTFFSIEAVPMGGTLAFEQYGGAVKYEDQAVYFAAVDLDLNPFAAFQPGGGLVFAMPWRVKPSATPQTILLHFENDPDFPQSYNTITDRQGVIFKRPVLTPGIFTISGDACDCPFQGDNDLDGFITALDLGAIIDILFAGHADVQDPLCLSPRFDLDCDGFVTSLDLGQMIDFLFAGGAAPCDPCAQP